MDLVVELLKSGDYWIAIVVVIVTIAINVPRVIEYYFLLRKNRMAQILSALQEPGVSEELKTHLRNELDIECFKGIHGTRVSFPMLKAVYVLNERVGATVSFRHVLKTVQLLPDISGVELLSYRIRLNILDKVIASYNLVFGLLVAGFGFITFLLSIYSIVTGFEPSLLISGVIFLPLGFYMLNDRGALFSVYHINRALNDYEKVTEKKSL
ncbi:hypothetical protein [Vibrio parahaemolyticus]|uniref:hypothetical protein n=1 Tax=Vibrio parahaemolyticus TaxID=670 RepID=UPI000C86E10E|nr:hypothetical protein [Vibrio parahaemolyticus]EIA1497369.1 hypothetical protein [Vibrio parahaemolyticus]ELA7323464.1 hypothetical protein [Vibrio parahaemolyticus]PMT58773.1 hypothetical protein C1S87_24765 [Vibrio parahaemolyticus]PMT83909.1 hypothetical protein C1S83_24995 [Vibrio parahaemolyticus]PMT85464.1 hypothetical protein C1T03_25170 [Vibrio parahaemolyticus]